MNESRKWERERKHQQIIIQKARERERVKERKETSWAKAPQRVCTNGVESSRLVPQYDRHNRSFMAQRVRFFPRDYGTDGANSLTLLPPHYFLTPFPSFSHFNVIEHALDFMFICVGFWILETLWRKWEPEGRIPIRGGGHTKDSGKKKDKDCECKWEGPCL